MAAGCPELGVVRFWNLGEYQHRKNGAKAGQADKNTPPRHVGQPYRPENRRDNRGESGHDSEL